VLILNIKQNLNRILNHYIVNIKQNLNRILNRYQHITFLLFDIMREIICSV